MHRSMMVVIARLTDAPTCSHTHVLTLTLTQGSISASAALLRGLKLHSPGEGAHAQCMVHMNMYIGYESAQVQPTAELVLHLINTTFPRYLVERNVLALDLPRISM